MAAAVSVIAAPFSPLSWALDESGGILEASAVSPARFLTSFAITVKPFRNTGSGRLTEALSARIFVCERNGFNGFNDVARSLRSCTDFVHGGDHTLHLPGAGVRI